MSSTRQEINKIFSDKFNDHWIKVKFYKKRLGLKDVKYLKNVRFCEATKAAILEPVVIDKDSLNCLGAKYAFGWESGAKDKNRLFEYCNDKIGAKSGFANELISQAPRLKESYEYIGLNTEDEPDLILSYMMPENVMILLNLYQNFRGKKLDLSLCSMMSICGGVAVKTFLEGNMNISFGCNDSRKYANIGKSRLAVGVPKNMFNIFELEKV